MLWCLRRCTNYATLRNAKQASEHCRPRRPQAPNILLGTTAAACLPTLRICSSCTFLSIFCKSFARSKLVNMSLTTARNVDHTKSVASELSTSSALRILGSYEFSVLTMPLQVRRRACDQHPKGNEHRRDGSETQACAKLYCLHMGPQVFRRLLGWHESVSIVSFWPKELEEWSWDS